MSLSNHSAWVLLLMFSIILAGCSKLVRKDSPTISHIHIGHALTGWPQTPNKRGLLVTAELSSVAAATNSDLFLQATRNGNFENAKKYLKEVVLNVDPALLDPSFAEDYGLRKSAAQAITHLRLASEVDDASTNVQRTITQTNIKASQIIDRADELTAFLDAGLKSEDILELEIIAEEVNRTLLSIAGGPEIASGYGLFELREDIEKMVAREDPPYQTVESWYLFNLVKLPDGQWGFSSRRSRGAAGVGY
ncbi:MAG: hypothetical protein V3U76_01000 [Granulosicoccus sp.]